jgi:hypothetical protein
MNLMDDSRGLGHKPRKAPDFRILALVFLMMTSSMLAVVCMITLRSVQSENATLAAHVKNLGE